MPDNTIEVPSGLSTTSGQFTALFTFVAIILSAVGYHYTPAQVEGWAQAANNLFMTLGPLLALVPVLLGFVNSRGKIQSNAINAQAHIATGVPVGASVLNTATELAPLVGSGKILGAVPDVIGTVGTMTAPGGFKDPHTYGQLLNVAKELGVPGAAQADAVNQQLHPAELITGILSLFHKKTKGST